MLGHKNDHTYGLETSLKGCLLFSGSVHSNSEIKTNRQGTATAGQET